jgi:TetR/AcrR family transcriptional regulator, fatty acid metabolism regulator protein
MNGKREIKMVTKVARATTEERKKQIIDEAIKIIHEEGYSTLSIRELSRRVGISEPAIYRHFLNKDDIIKGILDRIYLFGNDVYEKLNNSEEINEKIKSFVSYHFEYFENNPEMTSVVFSEDIFLHNKQLKVKLNEVIKQRRWILEKILDGAVTGEYSVKSNFEDISLVILGLVRMAVLEWRIAGYNYSLVKRGEKLLKSMERTGILLGKG